MPSTEQPKQSEPMNCCGTRENGKALLRSVIERHRRHADNLQRLHDMLPEKPAPEQDEALWSIVCQLPRP